MVEQNLDFGIAKQIDVNPRETGDDSHHKKSTLNAWLLGYQKKGTNKIGCAFSIKSPYKSIKEMCTSLQLTLFCCSLLMIT